MKKCDNCVGSDAIKKYADSDFLDISIIEDAAKKITGNTRMIRTSLLSVSDIFQVRRLAGGNTDINDIWLDCGVLMTCMCES